MDDRRTRKTRRLLREALADFLIEKSVDKITVKELTEKVDIHRSTFYGNFEDIYDLQDHTENIAFGEVKSLFQGGYHLKDFFIAILKYIDDNKKMSQLFFKGKIGHSFIDRLKEVFLDLYIARLRRKEYGADMTDEELRSYTSPYVAYLFAGSIDVINNWAKGEMSHSIEDVAEILYNLAKQIEDSLLVSLK